MKREAEESGELGMKIIVCIKQVPGTTKVDIDEKTGVLQREGVEAKMNPYDLYAIETAMQIKQSQGGSVRAITMGPAQAKEVLKEAFMMGVDECFLLSDRTLAGADVLATSYALSGLVQKTGAYDLIICGKQTTDGDTAQVGAEMAEFLAIPHVTNVTKIIHIESGYIRLEMDMAEYVQIQDVPFPCLITVEKDIYMPRLPSYRKKCETADKEIPVYTLQDLDDNDPMHYGLNGSPTQVERIFPPQSSSERVMIEGSADGIAGQLYQTLVEHKFL